MCQFRLFCEGCPIKFFGSFPSLLNIILENIMFKLICSSAIHIIHFCISVSLDKSRWQSMVRSVKPFVLLLIWTEIQWKQRRMYKNPAVLLWQDTPSFTVCLILFVYQGKPFYLITTQIVKFSFTRDKFKSGDAWWKAKNCLKLPCM